MIDLSIVRNVAIKYDVISVAAARLSKEGRMPHGCVPLQSITVAPRVWVLTGNRPGDNTKVLALAEELAWPFEIKQFVYKPHEAVPNLLLGATLAGIVKHQSSPVEAPWPDLVISAGRRNEPIARWIKRQSPDTIRLIHVGRPWGSIDRFDLLVPSRLPIKAMVDGAAIGARRLAGGSACAH